MSVFLFALSEAAAWHNAALGQCRFVSSKFFKMGYLAIHDGTILLHQ